MGKVNRNVLHTSISYQVQVQVQITLLLYETSNSLQLQNALHMEHNTELRFIQHSSTKQ